MDNKKLNEQESLELITQMIQNTKFKMVKNAGTPFLVWGYMTVVTSLLVWYLLKETGNYYWQFLWLLMPAVSYPVTIYSQRKKAKDGKNVYRPDSRICMGSFRTMRIADFMCIYDLLESAYTLCDSVDDGDGNYFNRTNYKYETGYGKRCAGYICIIGLPVYRQV